LLQVRNSTGAANSTLAIIEYLDGIVPQTKTSEHEEFESYNQGIELENVSFSYFDSSDLALKDISIKIKHGESVAIVGPSGGGKSTLVDLILGLITPSKGFAKVKGGDPKRVVQYSNSRIAFVPQNSSLISASLRENLLLGLPRSQFQDGELIQSLKSVGLDSEFRRQGIILDTNLGDHGIKLSGGQVQRLGIARALLTHPEILVLDEATSSLDAGSEKVISEALVDLHGKVTLIVIAHRLSTVREVDRIYYIDRGKLIAEGTFSELRRLIPDFDTQAKLMGL
jgi:ATP-binding cassette subfamily C protein